ncbi:hypothetical protein [Methanosarcina mazei]|nr:hypothetical protein [Methanosarcina mazei]
MDEKEFIKKRPYAISIKSIKDLEMIPTNIYYFHIIILVNDYGI